MTATTSIVQREISRIPDVGRLTIGQILIPWIFFVTGPNADWSAFDAAAFASKTLPRDWRLCNLSVVWLSQSMKIEMLAYTTMATQLTTVFTLPERLSAWISCAPH